MFHRLSNNNSLWTREPSLGFRPRFRKERPVKFLRETRRSPGISWTGTGCARPQSTINIIRSTFIFTERNPFCIHETWLGQNVLKLADHTINRLFHAHAATTTLLREDESLQVLQQKQLFIPRSKIQDLIEIGKG